MGRRSELSRSIVVAASVAIFAAAIISFPTAARSQSCDLGSIINDFANIGDALTGPACDAAYADSTALTLAATGLGGLLAADPSAGKSLCDAAQNAFSNGQTATDINQLVSNYFGPGVGSDLVTAVAGAAGGPLATLSCACTIDQGIGQIGSDIGSCFETALCDVFKLFPGQTCGTCQHPLPTPGADCAAPLSCAQNAHATDFDCTNAVYEDVTQKPPNYMVSGNYILDYSYGCGSCQWCSPQHFCSCPSPMKLVQVPVEWDRQNIAMFTCQCPNNPKDSNDPSNTHAPPPPPGIPESLAPPPPLQCICNNTGRVALPEGSPYGICPNLTGQQCAAGQQNVDNICVTPCSDPTKLQLADGSCCDPKQVSACGACCPSGQAPNPTTGNCSPIVLLPIRP
jgi:hypothetical protein